jgi:hypothetical protein
MQDKHSTTGDPAVGSTRLLAEVPDIAARTAHEIMAQIEFGVPTEELFALMVKNACLEAIVSSNTELRRGGDNH